MSRDLWFHSIVKVKLSNLKLVLFPLGFVAVSIVIGEEKENLSYSEDDWFHSDSLTITQSFAIMSLTEGTHISKNTSSLVMVKNGLVTV